ncbi:MAG TPA: ROK family protein [Longimicrobiales bacterium]|nr:ROK family protein [Longimicrobiales bacterium]
MKERQHTIGIDLGGTKVAGVLIDRSGHIVARERTSSLPERGADAVAETVALMVRALAAAAPSAVAGVGIGVAGQVDSANGTVQNAPNLRWHDYPLGDVVHDATGHRVAVLNDVQAATYGEWTYGAARGATEAICMFIGTGVGGGIISNGQLFRGKSGAAGELGHTVVSLHGPGCRCGGRGCLEAYAGGWAIARRSFDAVVARPLAGRALIDAAGGDASAITATALAKAMKAGDPLARTLVREIEDALVAGLGSITNALNPEVIILGGGVIEALPQLLEECRQRLSLQALPVSAAAVRVERAALAGDAGAIGAAAWARTAH